jgi:hypothetical protein
METKQAKHETTTETMKTRISEGEQQTETKLTITWDSPKDERAFASRGVRIAAQAMMRAAGDIPAELTVSVSELAKRERGGFAAKPTPASAQRLMAKLDDVQYEAALVQCFPSLSAGDRKRLVAARTKAPVPAPVQTSRSAPTPKPAPARVNSTIAPTA